MKKENLKYKEALNKIETIVEKIENDEPDIDELGSMIKEALSLLKLCKEKLKNTDVELNKAIEDFQ
ncbi:MAG: exodeoxyribonuclease VII small subunit [Bacteroidota bacterium]|jgi:exodeoxyribonuclease VII small subunit|nr:exodeoxyribonuclease VII small subunit [Bacteroidota bacterium]